MNAHDANISVKPNVMSLRKEVAPSAVPYELEPSLPGDLLVEFLGTRERSTLDKKLTKLQREEYEQSRFFQNQGQSGIAFENVSQPLPPVQNP